ncbi:MAG: potassium transporter KtrB [Lachnospiraceae bacterium]|nr:potassium transporter KtrB [Lachnospiraceae bacterium]
MVDNFIDDYKPKKKRSSTSTTKLIVSSFLVAIIIGTILLMLPISAADGKATPFMEALFSSTTAVCVIGITLFPTYLHWSLFGKIVILILVQLGGLGIVAFTTFLLVLIGKTVTLKDRLLVMDAFNLDTLGGLMQFLKFIFQITFSIEAVGAVLLAFEFVPKYGPAWGLFYSVFHSVSSFCNCGLDILGDNSLEDYVRDPYMNFVTMGLAITGGLGFVVWWDFVKVSKMVKRKEIRAREFLLKCTIHTKIVLVTSAILLFGGALVIFILEYSNPLTIADETLPQKIMQCLFQSSTCRSVGFDTIPQKNFKDVTAFFCMLLMIIGGSPVGTAGGVKTTTVAVVILETISAIKGRRDTIVFARTLPHRTVRKATMVLVVSISVWLFATILMGHFNGGDYLDLIYETTAAIGTAGLSRGYSSAENLSFIGKCIIIVLMYLGRIGPFSLAIAFKVSDERNPVQYKEEDITIG